MAESFETFPAGSVAAVNVSAIRTVDIRGTLVATAIAKTPVAGRVAFRGVNLDGDDQADRENHGGPDRALYAYAAEDYAWWNAEVGRTLAPGTFGENLTLRGIDVNGARIGERWRIGETLVQVTSPRVPCFKLAHVMGDPGFVKTFARALRPGTYLRVIEEGSIAAGDAAAVVHYPAHDLTVAEMARIYLFEKARVRELLAAPELPEFWRTWAEAEAG
jgi:MOSC domain-containing protein YiiM